jgi:hypothetical protein
MLLAIAALLADEAITVTGMEALSRWCPIFKYRTY